MNQNNGVCVCFECPLEVINVLALLNNSNFKISTSDMKKCELLIKCKICFDYSITTQWKNKYADSLLKDEKLANYFILDSDFELQNSKLHNSFDVDQARYLWEN